MENIIICVILAAYAILVDLQAAVLRSNANSIHDFQVLPLTIWGAVISLIAIVYVFTAFKTDLRKEMKKRRLRSRQKRAKP